MSTLHPGAAPGDTGTAPRPGGIGAPCAQRGARQRWRRLHRAHRAEGNRVRTPRSPSLPAAQLGPRVMHVAPGRVWGGAEMNVMNTAPQEPVHSRRSPRWVWRVRCGDCDRTRCRTRHPPHTTGHGLQLAGFGAVSGCCGLLANQGTRNVSGSGHGEQLHVPTRARSQGGPGEASGRCERACGRPGVRACGRAVVRAGVRASKICTHLSLGLHLRLRLQLAQGQGTALCTHRLGTGGEKEGTVGAREADGGMKAGRPHL